MNPCRRGWQAGVFVLILAVLNLGAWAQPAPLVKKLEPPNWWAHYTPDLTLLLTGENLSGARVESSNHGVKVEASHSSANGHYLFVRLSLSAGLKPGNADLLVKSKEGSAKVQLPLLARADSRGRFEGFSRDDVIYLIMPDRFADGDLSNDQPAGSTGVYDRNSPMAYHGGDLRGIRDHLDICTTSASTRYGSLQSGRTPTPITTAITSSTSMPSTNTWDPCRNTRPW
jgi:hypothetical protein